MSAFVTASQAVLEELYDDLTALVEPLDEGCLNWAPAGAESNSIAGLTRHIVGSTNSWLARALAESFPRDREAEFVARHTAAELVALVAASRQLAGEQFARLATVDPGLTRQVRRLSTNREMAVTVAWCVQHALIHAGEHWGQIQLNRQLYGMRDP
jgi:uncharacterized damage-inducible protein DinB